MGFAQRNFISKLESANYDKKDITCLNNELLPH